MCDDRPFVAAAQMNRCYNQRSTFHESAQFVLIFSEPRQADCDNRLIEEKL